MAAVIKFYSFSVLIATIFLQIGSSYGYVSLFAPFNAIGLRGNITFRQENNESPVTIAINLDPVIPRTNSIDYSWKIMSYPHLGESPCNPENLGRVEADMTVKHGPIQVPVVNLGGQIFTDSDLSLHGQRTIWSSSIIIMKDNRTVGCSNIALEGDAKTAMVQFIDPAFGGTILFRENEFGSTIILSNLFYITDDFRTTSQHDWKILVTDILDARPNTDRKCHYLSTLLDPENVEDSECSNESHEKCKVGDLTRKHGKVTVYNANGRNSKQKFIDTNLALSLFESTRSSYVVIYEKNNPTRVLTCGLIVPVQKKEVKAVFDMDGVKGHIGFSQAFKTDPTIVTIKLQNLKGRGHFYKVHSFPIEPMLIPSEKVCSLNSTGNAYNPFKVSKNLEPNKGTSDQYQVGDLSGKYGPLTNDQNADVIAIHVDLNLPLFGRHSIIGRSIVIQKVDGSSWICATIGYPAPMTTAMAIFHFPIAGRIIFRQETNNPIGETTVLADLSYSDGSANNTFAHAWHVHENSIGGDWYNWSERCFSTGGHHNPASVGLKKYSLCNPNNPYRCELGDTAGKSGERLSIAGYKGSQQVKLFYTDPILPLFGPFSILGRSITVHDDNGPKQRGNRLACTNIKEVHPVTAAVRSWRYSGDKPKVSGSIVFHQATQMDGSAVKFDFHGLGGLAKGFHVHEVSVPEDREFPCSQDSVYGHFDPLSIGTAVTLYPGVGSSDQYEIGDISGKIGTLAGKESWRHSYTDYNLPLFGLNSIVGRSMVIHKEEKNARWVCGTIIPEVRKNEGREIIALASFDDPQHLIQGYVRFHQFEYKDGSTSDTWLEIDLRHTGVHNRNITSGHQWSVFVNQVGSDAFHVVESVRCVAGGYIWNPYLTDATNNRDLYRKDCSPLNPLRCQMGDLAGRLGPLSIGGKRKVVADSNLPLVGNYSVLGRSLIIYHKDGSDVKMACANILNDFHLASSISVRSNPTFTVARFMDHMRKQLKTTDWLIRADSQSIKSMLDGECVQLTVNFYGQHAYRLKESFTNLVNFGTVQEKGLGGSVSKLSTPYSACKQIASGSIGIRTSRLSLILTLIGVFLPWKFFV